METIRIKALVSAMGLSRGDVVDVELNSHTDAMVIQGYWLWLDEPEWTYEPEVEITKVVAGRQTIALNYMAFPDEDDADGESPTPSE